MIGYKGFDKDLKCKGFQYRVGEIYKLDEEIKICERGFHFCDIPTAVFEFYAPVDSRFALVEATGSIADDGKHKFCTDEIKIVKELTLTEMIAMTSTVYTNAGSWSVASNIGYCSVATGTGNWSVASNTGNWSVATGTGNWSVATGTGNWSAATNTGDCSVASNTGNWSAATNTGNCSAASNTGNCSVATGTGNWSVASNTGNCSAATNTGDCSAATNTGYCSVASVSGKSSVAAVFGRDSKAKGAFGCWLVLSEWNNSEIKDMQCFKVDGEIIKADVFYTLRDGKPVEADKLEE